MGFFAAGSNGSGFFSLTLPPLDQVTSAAVAYGLRKLRSAYSGSALRVRRSSDSAEQDIGFTASGDLDTTNLLSFCGAGSGFVSKWYDQSGNGKDAVQATSGNQPRIVLSGVVETKNTLPAINNNSGWLVAPFTGMIPGAAMSLVATVTVNDTTPGYSRIVTAFKTGDPVDYNGSTSLQFLALGTAASNVLQAIQAPGVTVTNNVPLTASFAGGNGSTTLFINGSAAASGSRVVTVSTADKLIIGAGSDAGVVGASPLTGYYSEILIYASILDTVGRQTLENSQIAYYKTV